MIACYFKQLAGGVFLFSVFLFFSKIVYKKGVFVN